MFDVINIEAAGSGTGSGSLSAAPARLTIDCRITAGVTSGSCDDEFNDAGGGGVFSVTATPDNGSEFSLWDRLECSPEVVGACDLDCGANGADPNCTLSVDDQSGDVSFRVTARFSAVSDPEPTVIQGFVLDTAASPNPVSGVWASAALNEMVVSVDTSDALGFFLHDVATGGDYAAVAVGKLGLLAFSVRDSVQVATGDTAVASLNARADASLAFTNGVGDLTAAAGATVTLPAFDWQVWSRTGGRPGCSHWVVIGVDGEPAAAFQVAVPGPYPGVSGQETLQITAPAELGTYGVFANRFSVTTEQDARDEYVVRYPSMDRRTFEFIQLGTLTVE